MALPDKYFGLQLSANKYLTFRNRFVHVNEISLVLLNYHFKYPYLTTTCINVMQQR